MDLAARLKNEDLESTRHSSAPGYLPHELRHRGRELDIISSEARRTFELKNDGIRLTIVSVVFDPTRCPEGQRGRRWGCPYFAATQYKY